jgi:hypothetical protein
MKDGQLFKVKVIKTEADLPKRNGYYICKPVGDFAGEVKFNFDDETERNLWMVEVDWYLEPIEEQEPDINTPFFGNSGVKIPMTEQITDSDIEAWASTQALSESRKDFERGLWLGLKVGAKAVLNGEIKRLKNENK